MPHETQFGVTTQTASCARAAGSCPSWPHVRRDSTSTRCAGHGPASATRRSWCRTSTCVRTTRRRTGWRAAPSGPYVTGGEGVAPGARSEAARASLAERLRAGRAGDVTRGVPARATRRSVARHERCCCCRRRSPPRRTSLLHVRDELLGAARLPSHRGGRRSTCPARAESAIPEMADLAGCRHRRPGPRRRRRRPALRRAVRGPFGPGDELGLPAPSARSAPARRDAAGRRGRGGRRRRRRALRRSSLARPRQRHAP